MERNLRGLEEMSQLANEFMDNLRTSNVIALVGELGVGKTTFVQNIGKSLDIPEEITSPTFLLMKVHRVQNHAHVKNLIHLDLYRINSWDEIAMLGLEELWNDPQNLIFIEWADRIKENLPPQTQYIEIKHVNENERAVTIS